LVAIGNHKEVVSKGRFEKNRIRLEYRSTGRIYDLVKAPRKNKASGPQELIDFVKQRLPFVEFHEYGGTLRTAASVSRSL